jgi:hypothetical protein
MNSIVLVVRLSRSAILILATNVLCLLFQRSHFVSALLFSDQCSKRCLMTSLTCLGFGALI